MRTLKSFDELKDGDKVICLVDNQTMYCYVDKRDGEKFHALDTTLHPVSEFDVKDFVYAEIDTSHKCAVTGEPCPYEVSEYGTVPCNSCETGKSFMEHYTPIHDDF